MVRAFFIVVAAIALQLAVVRASDSWRVEVRETAGIQRFKYPVSAEFRAGGTTSENAGFELQGPAGPIAAQFTKLPDPETNGQSLWSVDFQVDLSPRGTRTFTVHRREHPGKEPSGRRGLSVEREGGNVHVRHPTLQFVVAEDLRGLFQQIEIAGDDWLRRGSPGMFVRIRDGQELPLAPAEGDASRGSVQVIKSGPMAVRLRFDIPIKLLDGSDVDSIVVLDFPLGKSWASVDWTLDDPADAVDGLRAAVRLRLDHDAKRPVLADVGAGGWTYAALRAGETLAYRAGQPSKPSPITWRVDRVTAEATTPYVLPGLSGNGPPPEGWAHLMDRSKCTAIAVDRFASATRDAIELSADGLVQLRRDFSPDSAAAGQSKPKRFTFWLHVVSSPPQVGAATSPQSMQAPPEVRVLPVADGRATE